MFSRYGYRYLETPMFEKTEVFTRGIGEATDIVGKEMYFVYPMSAIEKLGNAGDRADGKISGDSKKSENAAYLANAKNTSSAESAANGEYGVGSRGDGESSENAASASADNSNTVELDKSTLLGLALRPEGTAGTARAVVQHNLCAPGTPTTKLWYAGSMFRHERQQKGRYREFRQIGAECIGATEPSADAEVILMLMSFFESLGIPRAQMVLKVNSMGDENCRPLYQAAVKDFILGRTEVFCPECLRRANTNPLRAFDCKNPACKQMLEDAPQITSFHCEECSAQYSAVKQLLTAAGLDFEEDDRLVRGFDYYTRTVFEVQVELGLGAQNAIGGGGRYDGLLEQYGAKHTPSLGFAVGLERILLVLEALGAAPELPVAAEVFIAAVDEEARLAAFSLACELRAHGVSTEMDHQARSLKSQFKVADKLGAAYTVVIGPDEMAEGVFSLRSMTESTQQTVTKEKLIETLTS